MINYDLINISLYSSFNDALIYAEQRNKFEQRQPVGEYDQIRHCSKVFL